ncbi:MAG: hypothetical protein Q9180_004839, partial [Flavoplaca navasiana]
MSSHVRPSKELSIAFEYLDFQHTLTQSALKNPGDGPLNSSSYCCCCYSAASFCGGYGPSSAAILHDRISFRLCDSVVYGPLPGRGRRVWQSGQFRFRVIYTLPQLRLEKGLWGKNGDDNVDLHELSYIEEWSDRMNSRPSLIQRIFRQNSNTFLKAWHYNSRTFSFLIQGLKGILHHVVQTTGAQNISARCPSLSSRRFFSKYHPFISSLRKFFNCTNGGFEESSLREGREIYVTVDLTSDSEIDIFEPTGKQSGAASWASFTWIMQRTCNASLRFEIAEGDADLCPSDLPNVPMQVSLRDIAILGLQIGMKATSSYIDIETGLDAGHGLLVNRTERKIKRQRRSTSSLDDPPVTSSPKSTYDPKFQDIDSYGLEPPRDMHGRILLVEKPSNMNSQPSAVPRTEADDENLGHYDSGLNESPAHDDKGIVFDAMGVASEPDPQFKGNSQHGLELIPAEESVSMVFLGPVPASKDHLELATIKSAEIGVSNARGSERNLEEHEQGESLLSTSPSKAPTSPLLLLEDEKKVSSEGHDRKASRSSFHASGDPTGTKGSESRQDAEREKPTKRRPRYRDESSDSLYYEDEQPY